MNIKKILVKYWIGILAVILLLAVIISSIQIYKEEVLKIDPDIEYVHHTTMNIPSDYIDTLNPILSKSKDVFQISKLIYEPLFSYDKDLGLKPCLVEKYEINASGNGVKITLKDGIYWHNGKRLTAYDVIFTIEAMRFAGTSCPYSEKIGKIHSFYSMGERTLMIFFRFKTDCSLSNLSFPILCQKSFSGIREAATSKHGFKPVGTGPYMFKSYNPKKKLKLIPFNKYYGTKTGNKVNFVFMPDRDLAKNLMDIKEITCYVDDRINRKANLNNEDYTTFDLISNKVDFLAFNGNEGPTIHKEFRQALCYAIDVEYILENAYMGDGELTETLYYPNYFGDKSEVNFYRYDEKKALNLLNKLGYYDSKDEGELKDENGNKFELKILVLKNKPMRNSAAKIIKKTLKRIGIETKILSFKKAEYEKALKEKNFDILIAGLSVDESYDLSFLFNGTNPWKYSNTKILKKAEELKKLYTIEDYREKYKELKGTLVDEVPYYPLCYKKMSLIGLSNFKIIESPVFNQFYNGVGTWSYDEEKNDKKQ